MEVQLWFFGYPSIRQMKARPYSEVPVGVKPDTSMASKPVVSVGSQPTWICPLKGRKSTATTTPVVVVQSATGLAEACEAGPPTESVRAVPTPPRLVARTTAARLEPRSRRCHLLPADLVFTVAPEQSGWGQRRTRSAC